ncbi:hypothetical protein [Lacipirellula parvula]|nr:hypothetical protein [Lacipirellula parvula]
MPQRFAALPPGGARGWKCTFASLCCALIVATSSLARAQEPAPAKLAITQLKIGFGGEYKFGCWTPVEVVIQGGGDAFTGTVQVITPDPEGVPTSVFTPADRPVGVFAGKTSSARLFIRPGQDGAKYEVRLLDEQGRTRTSKQFIPNAEPGDEFIPFGSPATSRFIATFGMQRGLGELTRSDGSQDSATATEAVKIDDAAELPTEWYGYEAFDLVVLGGGDAELYRPLTANPARIEALRKWVELGGRLVIFCGGNAPELIGPDGPLATFVPGRFDDMSTLREAQPIEGFAVANESIPGGANLRLQTPRIVDVEGRILAFSGQNSSDLPLVIRARRGLGEVTFVAFDPDVAPLSDWGGRTNLLRQALQWPSAETSTNQYGYQDDMTDRLRRALDASFEGVTTAPFGLVALLVIGYILLIGPGDYFLVKNLLRRMELTWITFPLMVVGVSFAAYWAAHWMKGNSLRVNQVEFVDVDVANGAARGTVYTHFFSPRVERYNLSLASSFAKKPISEPGRPDLGAGDPSLVAWLGATGYGLDGMRSSGAQATLFESGYAFNPPLTEMNGLPVQEWSTRTLIGRWTGALDEPIVAELRSLDDDLVAGHLTNRTGVALTDCVLMHGRYAYALPDLADGAVATIDDTIQPTQVRTALLKVSGKQTASQPGSGPITLDVNGIDVNELAVAMMFYNALGGESYAQGPNRYQPFLDMTKLLAGKQAILLARGVDDPGSNWKNGDLPLASDHDRRWVYYRFVIPLEEEDE